MFTQAIVRPPGPSFARGLTAAGLGAPEMEKALAQHRAYVMALKRHGCSGTTISLKTLLHLKTGVSWLGGNTLLAAGELGDCAALAGYERILAAAGESYAANVLRVNRHVIMPDGHPGTREKLEAAGYSVIAVAMTEFQKMDGGVSCLSLRF